MESISAAAEGRKLAIAMLREYCNLQPGECSYEEFFRPGSMQRDVLHSYLERLIASGLRFAAASAQ